MAANILLIEYDPAVAKAVRAALGGPFHVEWFQSCSEGLARLAREGNEEAQESELAAVLVDLFLPDSQGIETFERLAVAARQIPILVLCATLDEDVAKLAVQKGAHDYLLKSRLDDYLLPKAVASMVGRAANAESLFEEKERAEVTLNSIGDAVMSTDVRGNVTYLNLVAESLTGWSRQEAAGHPVEEVFRIIDAMTREPARNPMAVAIRENRTVSLTPNCVLVRRGGGETGIDDSAAPIHDRRGRVIGAVMVFHDVSATRAITLRMSYLAQHDSLTDLPNRLLFSDRLNQAMGMAHRHQQQLAVLFLDIDHFKHVNDSLGHAVGDRLLQSVAKRLVACVRSSDTVSRQGGDEFVILLSTIKYAQDAAVCADKILLALSPPHVIDQHELHLTGSIGIATYPDDGRDAETLLQHADSAMYHAKEIGNAYQFYTPAMNLLAVEQQRLEHGLRHAVEREELVLHYQPKMNLETGTIIGAEALIRWRRPEGGLVAPGEFIPIAEDRGLIVPIGQWVLREACRQARAWQEAGLPRIRVAINISAVELRARDFVASLRTILAETDFAPHLLELELTETFLLQDTKATAAVLGAVKDLGVRLALDDFGTGYSSLSYLKRFPIDTLKIDRSFVRDLTTDPDDAAIVSAVIGMGRSLHMQVVAEGVETPAQLAFLLKRRCPEGQGYYFSQPVVAGRFANQLASSAVGVSQRRATAARDQLPALGR